MAVVGIVSTALQVVGLVGVAVGFKRVDVALSAGAPGSLFGLTLKLTH